MGPRPNGGRPLTRAPRLVLGPPGCTCSPTPATIEPSQIPAYTGKPPHRRGRGRGARHARFTGMASRRGSSHVRPRAPSSGRPRVQPVKAKAPERRRVREHKGLDARRRRVPVVTRTVLALCVVALGAVAFATAAGGIGPLLSTLGSGFGTAVGNLTATSSPSQTPLPVTDSPRIA